MTESIRILLADDHAVLRSGLRLLIDQQDDMQVIGEAGDGREVITVAQQLQPDVILLDINMPHIDGLSALEPLREVAPQARILILTMHDDGDYLRHALQSGASGYVLKQAVDHELLLAIRAVMRGETPIHSAMTSKLFQPGTTINTDGKDNPWGTLSEREHNVLRLVALGYTNSEIGEELFLSVKTVETYRARGMEKLDLKTRAQLVKSALHHGILGDES
jgi:DNA-binding NarL/FixJ family response regulator